MTSSKTKRKALVLKSSIAAIAAAIVMFSLVAAQVISQQSVIAQMSTSQGSNNASSSSANMATTTSGAPGSVFKLSRANIPIDIPLKEGFVNGNPVFYINTDISDQKLASQLTSTTGFRVNYASLLAQAPNDGVAQFYVFKNGIKGNGIFGFQPTVGNAQPGDANYSPLWRINIVEWKNGITLIQLKSEKEVMDAKAKGDLTVTSTNIVANCPFVKWNGGQMKIREGKNINDDSKYMGGQVLRIDTDKMIVTMVAHRGFGPDGKTIYYIVADATPQMPAGMMGATFASLDEKLLSSAALVDLFQFTNGINGSGPMGFQAGIGAANPTDPNYSPMWKISFNEWKEPSKARILETVSDILAMKQAGVGTQIFISSYSKGLGCSIDKKKKGILGASSGGTAISSFFSFFSLVPLGCCGSWLLILSLLPSVFGSSLSVALILYSKSFSYAGLAIVFGFAALSAFKLQKELKHMKKRKGVQKVRENNSGFGS